MKAPVEIEGGGQRDPGPVEKVLHLGTRAASADSNPSAAEPELEEDMRTSTTSLQGLSNSDY